MIDFRRTDLHWIIVLVVLSGEALLIFRPPPVVALIPALGVQMMIWTKFGDVVKCSGRRDAVKFLVANQVVWAILSGLLALAYYWLWSTR